jgi:putative sigma-54 modulation protein
MQINISGHHIDVTDAISDAVKTKCKKLGKHYPDIQDIKVILTVEKHEQIAEGVVHYFGQDLVAKGKAEDLYQSIADMTTKLESLLQKRKEIVKSHSSTKPELIEEPTTGEEELDEEYDA